MTKYLFHTYLNTKNINIFLGTRYDSCKTIDEEPEQWRQELLSRHVVQAHGDRVEQHLLRN